MIKNNLGVGALSQIGKKLVQSQAGQTLLQDVERSNYLIINVKGPKGFGKAKPKVTKRAVSNSYYYYDIMSLMDGTVYRNVMAGDNIETLENRAGLSKVGFIGQMCSVKFNSSGSVENGKAFLKPFDDRGFKQSDLDRVENAFAKSVKPSLFGLKAIAESAIDELKAIYSLDDK